MSKFIILALAAIGLISIGDDAIDAIVNKMPKSTTVDLVRCKDCIYRDHSICYAHSTEVYVREDDFCSRGRREE